MSCQDIDSGILLRRSVVETTGLYLGMQIRITLLFISVICLFVKSTKSTRQILLLKNYCYIIYLLLILVNIYSNS